MSFTGRLTPAVAAAVLTATGLLGTSAAAATPGVAAVAASEVAAPVPAPVSSLDGANVVEQKWLDERTLDIKISSPAVGRTVPVRLLLPVGWTPEATRTWPLVLMLHGGEDDYTSWTRETDVEVKAAKAQVIVAMPDASYKAAYTNYFKAPAAGGLKWEDFHTQELLQILERGYHAGQQRAVAGLSLGGLGSMSYAGRHPELFKYAASYSGPVSLRTTGARSVLTVIFGDEDPFARYGVPFVDEANWIAHDPVALAKKYKGMGLYVSSGTTGLPAPDDTKPWAPIQLGEPAVAAMNAQFVAELDKNKIPVTKHFYTLGLHNWVSWQRELNTSWPLMLKAIGA